MVQHAARCSRDDLCAAPELASLPLLWVVANGFESGARARRALGVFFAAVALASLYAMVQAWACTSAVPLPAWAGVALKVRLEACPERGERGDLSLTLCYDVANDRWTCLPPGRPSRR